MSHHKIQNITQDDVDQLADFLHRSITDFQEVNPYGSHGVVRSRDEICENLKSTFEHHLTLDPTGNFGLKLCQDETICGCLLFFPQIYRYQGKTYRALGSGSFFVDPKARMQGFFMFRKYLATPGYDFYFGNTCNTNSIALWQNCKGHVVPNSDIEYLILLKPAAIFEELVLRKNKPYLKPLARLAGHLAGCFTTWRRNVDLEVTPASSHEQLAKIAETVCIDTLVTTDRSVKYLKTRYPNLTQTADKSQPQIFVIRASQKPCGWFVIDQSKRGKNQQINAARVLDVVWQRDQITLKQILKAIASSLDPSIDMISVRARPGICLDTKMPHSYQRQLPAPESAVLAKCDIEGLAEKIDFATIDTV